MAVSNADAPWVLVGVGAALIGVAIPISIKANNQAFKAAERLNQVNAANPTIPIVFDLIGTPHGIGLSFSF